MVKVLKLEDLIKQTKEIFLSKKETNKNMKEEDIEYNSKFYFKVC